MKKIIGWFKNILMRILEVVNYMIKKDKETELAKLEVKREIAKDVFEAVSNTLSNKKAQIVLGCAAVGLGIGLLYISNCNFDTPQNILAN